MIDTGRLFEVANRENKPMVETVRLVWGEITEELLT